MFCNQCEQTTRSGTEIGCMIEGVCGKTAKTASLQDIIIYALEGLSVYACALNDAGEDIKEINNLMLYATFSTLTNVNFDDDSLFKIIQQISDSISSAKLKCQEKSIVIEGLPAAAKFRAANDVAAMVKKGDKLAIMNKRGSDNKDVDSLRLLVLFGIKGVAAYTHHARMLKQDVNDLATEIQKAYLLLASHIHGTNGWRSFLSDAKHLTTQSDDAEILLTSSLKIGELNLKAMELLDAGHQNNFGIPEPTEVRTNGVKGKAILLSGHDLIDLEEILKQTEGKGINVYTHGEMLPGNSYPGLKKYPHLVGNYGGAWQNQQVEFTKFPGAILMTSNCIQKPMSGYEKRIFTTGPVAWPNVKHISNGDFSEVIECALSLEGFKSDEEDRKITIGFGRDAVLGVADKIIDAVKSGAIKRFYVVGGCDGAELGRNYFTDIANNISDDSVILTLGCGKYRFNKQEFGDIGGIPRLLDVGQCNDTYSAIKIAVALADAFECGVNDLPLSFYISWLEQKAVAVFLTLLYLGIKDIHLGPALPGFLTDNVINILVEKFGVKPTTDAVKDIAAELA